MLHYIENEAKARAAKASTQAIIENVSRRHILGGALVGTGLVLAVKIAPAIAREPLEALSDRRGGHVRQDPARSAHLYRHRQERRRDDRDASRGDGHGHPHQVCRWWWPTKWKPTGRACNLVQAEGDEPKYGNQDTDGSRSMRHFIQPMRQCGAAMRQMLEAAAAAKWGVDAKLCKAKAHAVVKLDGSGKETGDSIGFGDLAEAAMALPTPAISTLTFKTNDEFTLIRKGETKIVDLRNITVGKAVYGADVRLPGMKFAAMVRPDVLGAKIKSYDAAEALKVPGVEKVVEIEGVYAVPRKFGQLGGLAVVANTTWAAFLGRDAITVEWDLGANASYDSTAYAKEMSATAAKPGKAIRNQGDVDAAFAKAKQVFSEEYHATHLVQAAMEPLVATARIKDGKAEIWAPCRARTARARTSPKRSR